MNITFQYKIIPKDENKSIIIEKNNIDNSKLIFGPINNELIDATITQIQEYSQEMIEELAEELTGKLKGDNQ